MRVPAAIILLALAPEPAAAMTVNTVRDVIPQLLSEEIEQNAEPGIAVDPADPTHVVVVPSWTQGNCGPEALPLFESRDTGLSFLENCAIPKGSGVIGFAFSTLGNMLYSNQLGEGFFTLWDPTVTFGPNGVLYAAYLRLGYLSLTRFPQVSWAKSRFLRKEAPTFVPPRIFDQPWPAASLQGTREWVVVAGNDVRRQAWDHAVVLASTTGADGDSYAIHSLETDSRVTHHGSSVRVAIHPNTGRVYALMSRAPTVRPAQIQAHVLRQSRLQSQNTGQVVLDTHGVPMRDQVDVYVYLHDIVVLRSDRTGTSGNAFNFSALMTGSHNGVVVKQNAPVPQYDGYITELGYQRVTGPSPALAVDPSDASGNRVYVAWTDGDGFNAMTLRLAESVDGGQSWAENGWNMRGGINAGLAVNNLGDVGLLYQVYDATNNRWRTEIQLFDHSGHGGALVVRPSSHAELADVSADYRDLMPARFPYLGDYTQLVSVGADFFGVFASANSANRLGAHVTYHANVHFNRIRDGTTRRMRNLNNNADVAPSIDPFFVHVTP